MARVQGAVRVGKEIRLCRRLMLLFLEAAEKHVEQAFGGRRCAAQPEGAGDKGGGRGQLRRRKR